MKKMFMEPSYTVIWEFITTNCYRKLVLLLLASELKAWILVPHSWIFASKHLILYFPKFCGELFFWWVHHGTKKCALSLDVYLWLCRPVGSKFEMVRPYYSAKRVHNILGHAHLPSPQHATRYPSSRMLQLSNCFLGRFEALVTES